MPDHKSLSRWSSADRHGRRFDRELARHIIDFDPADADPTLAAIAPRERLNIKFPADLTPQPAPPAQHPSADDPLPRADYVVITWTRAELEALAAVFTPEAEVRYPWTDGAPHWFPYSRHWDDVYSDQIARGAPAWDSNPDPRLGLYLPVTVGDKSVLCMKSELHLNQDGIPTGDGTATLPVAELFRQIIDEAQPHMIITTGTAGATYRSHGLGDVIVTRAARFLLSDEFSNEKYNHETYRSEFEIGTRYLGAAQRLMQPYSDKLREPPVGPPTKTYTWPEGIAAPAYHSEIKLDGRDFRAFHPMLTTDVFDIGTSGPPHLDRQGCGVEMGDAVLGMVCQELGAESPRWLVVRNASDPQINGDLIKEIQTEYAVWYYDHNGYWTSVNSALACWAVIAGDEPSTG